MKKVLALMAGAAALMAASVAAQVTISGYVLKSYATGGGSFARDGAISSFWADWSVREQVDMTPETNGWVGGGNSFSGTADCEFKIRSAYDADALYLLFEITDNTWQPPAGYDADGIDFLMDIISSQAIRDANPYDLYIQPSYGWTLTYYSVQYQINVGAAGAALPTYMMINYFSGSAMMYNRTNLTQLPTDYTGWDLDMASPSANVRNLELKIPWNWVGCSGGLGSQPANGTLVAMAGGYNDSDSPTQTGRRGLRWKERDPFNTCNDYPTPHQMCDSWGDIQIGGTDAVRPHSAAPSRTTGSAAPAQYFTVKGERLSGSQFKNLRTGTMVVERGIAGGRAVSRMIHTK